MRIVSWRKLFINQLLRSLSSFGLKCWMKSSGKNAINFVIERENCASCWNLKLVRNKSFLLINSNSTRSITKPQWALKVSFLKKMKKKNEIQLSTILSLEDLLWRCQRVDESYQLKFTILWWYGMRGKKMTFQNFLLSPNEWMIREKSDERKFSHEKSKRNLFTSSSSLDMEKMYSLFTFTSIIVS